MTGFRSSVEPDHYDNIPDADAPLPISFESVTESGSQPEAESPHTMPSLTSDWESIPDIDVDGQEYERPSSPLPPSSPMSYSVSILSRSVSLASSPEMRPSSPLSEISSLDQEERQVGDVENVHMCRPDTEIKIRSSLSPATFVSRASFYDFLIFFTHIFIYVGVEC